MGSFYDWVVSLRSVSLSVIKLFRSFPVMVISGHYRFLQSMFDFRPKTPEPARPERAEAFKS